VVIGPRLFDSRRAGIHPLPATDAGRIGIYVCGVTPYDTTHLGHAFTYLAFDVLIRHLQGRGYTTTYVQNLTDVDDDLFRRARQVGENWQSLAAGHTARFLADMADLNWLPPDVYAAASDHVPQAISLVERLLAAGLAYQADGHVYLAVRQDPNFGEVSHLPPAEWLAVANERGNLPDLPGKRDPLDPVLWQPSLADEPAWEAPFGPGRPGWHIECSAMGTAYLGPSFTIHGGGADLAFPHHEVERVQTEGGFGVRPAVEFWAHTGMLEFEGEKMSKSLGNLVLVRDLLDEWSADVVRLTLISPHYREPFTFTGADLAATRTRVEGWSAAAALAGDGVDSETVTGLRAAFLAALDEDLDTSTACAVIDRLSQLAQANPAEAGVAGRAVADLAGRILGLRLDRAST
jgi:L-cysteine:1D-myo-inositol 2-amino-2-deoxy-alpha-D-glucopyranoside ligase